MATIGRWVVYVVTFALAFLAGYGFAAVAWGPRW